MNRCVERLQNGLIKENPTFVLMLGMCPTLAVTSSAFNGLGMGLTTTLVLVMSNTIISLLRNVIPDRVRMPAFIVIVASFVTIVQLLLQGYMPSLYDTLGIYIPLIVVNCIILGRAEAYASKNPVLPSTFDGLGMGLGFTMGLTLIGIFRELIGSGMVFGFKVMPDAYEPFAIFVMAPGAFFVLSMLTAVQNKLKLKGASNVPAAADNGFGCGGNCASCLDGICAANHEVINKAAEEKKAAAAKAAEEKKAAAMKAAEEKKAAAMKAAEEKKAAAVKTSEDKKGDR